MRDTIFKLSPGAMTDSSLSPQAGNLRIQLWRRWIQRVRGYACDALLLLPELIAVSHSSRSMEKSNSGEDSGSRDGGCARYALHAVCWRQT